MPISEVTPQSIRNVEAEDRTWNDVCRTPAGAERIAAADNGQSHGGVILASVSARSESKRTVRDFRR